MTPTEELARATLLDSAGTEAVREALRRTYGLFGRLTVSLSRLRRGGDGTVGIRVVLDQE